MFRVEYYSLHLIIKIYNRRKAVGTQRLVLDAPNDRVIIMEQYFDPDTGVMGERQAGTVSRDDIITARNEVAEARTLINAFVTEVQGLT